MIGLPLLGAFLESVGMILEKKILKNRLIDFRNYTAYGFLAIVLLMIPMLFFTWRVEAQAFEFYNVLIFLFIVCIAVMANLLIFYSLKRENISEFEPLWLMQPLFVVFLAFVFFETERNFVYVVLALIASLTLVLTHVKKHHLKFDKYIIAALFGSFLFAVELIASKPLLEYYSAFSFYFLRCLLVLFIVFAIYRPAFKPVRRSGTLWMILLVSFLWIFYRVITYYGYVKFGVIFTTILFLVSPVFIFIFAIIFLKEKPNWRQIVSTVVILVCAAAAIFV